MEVIVDGSDNFAVAGQPADVLAVVSAAEEFLRQQGRMIVGVAVDGRDVLPEDLLGALEDREPDSVGRLEIQSEDLGRLVEDSLAELRSTLPELPAACHELSRIFHGDEPDSGFDPFEQLAEIWGHIKQREQMVARALGLNLNELSLEGAPLERLHEELNGFLAEAEAALRNKDLILLGDLLEYELAPRAERETAIVALLQEHATARTR
jgi:hypothetical protein